MPNRNLMRVLYSSGLLRTMVGLLIVTASIAKPPPASLDIVSAARSQIGVTLLYKPAYEKMAYPNGDVPRQRGVCTDVIIRALRDARGIDLQQEVHSDMQKAGAAYPNNWSRNAQAKQKLDTNIDHRRVPNLMTYFARRKIAVTATLGATSYLPGDIVAWNLGKGLQHIGIVTDKITASGTPLIIHNIGRGALEEDILKEYRIIGHYRFPALPAVIE
jgi:uncharacterized protein